MESESLKSYQFSSLKKATSCPNEDAPQYTKHMHIQYLSVGLREGQVWGKDALRGALNNSTAPLLSPHDRGSPMYYTSRQAHTDE